MWRIGVVYDNMIFWNYLKQLFSYNLVKTCESFQISGWLCLFHQKHGHSGGWSIFTRARWTASSHRVHVQFVFVWEIFLDKNDFFVKIAQSFE